MEGKVIRKVDGKGFGFISGTDGDIFFHMSALKNSTFDSLQVGQTVSFDYKDSPKGLRAENIYVQ